MNASKLVLAVLILFAAATASADHTADGMFIFFASDTFFEEFSGHQSEGDLLIDWAVEASDATIWFLGTPGGDGVLLAGFDLRWNAPDPTMPIAINVTSANDAPYTFHPYFKRYGEDDPDFSLVQTGVTNDFTFGHHFSPCEWLSIALVLDDPDSDYDLTVSMEWGDGVAAEEKSWGEVKQLFR